MLSRFAPKVFKLFSESPVMNNKINMKYRSNNHNINW